MFEGRDYPKSLDEDQFEEWLEQGRANPINYEYMLIIWDEFEGEYRSDYVESRGQLMNRPLYGKEIAQETVVAVYDLYSESRIPL